MPKSSARGTTRPGGPSGPGRGQASSKPRIEAAGARGSLMGAFTWRSGVLVVVVVLALAVLLPSLRVYFAQQDDLRQLRAERDAAAAAVVDIRAEAARWDDPAFVIAQARERLAYVFPGETPYRVTDPEVITGTEEVTEDPLAEAPGPANSPWYSTLLDSIEEAGSPSPEPTAAP